MKNFYNGIKAAAAGVAGTLFAAPAFAAVDLTGVSVDVTSVESLTAIILVGLGVLWGIRKLIKTLNRS